jgi:hypothetical protein
MAKKHSEIAAVTRETGVILSSPQLPVREALCRTTKSASRATRDQARYDNSQARRRVQSQRID